MTKDLCYPVMFLRTVLTSLMSSLLIYVFRYRINYEKAYGSQ
jgi:hypothetical protein